MELEKVESRKSKVESQLQNTFVAWSKNPFIARDIAVWIPKEIDPDEIVSLCKKEAGEMLVKEPQVFDRFEKEGRVSVALRMIFQSNEKTLSDEEVNTVMQNITKTLQNKGFEVR